MFNTLLTCAGAIAMVAGAAPRAVAQAPRSSNATGFVITVGDPVHTTPELPPVWIGVRMVPVPAALKAHLSHGELMVANVVTDSPADNAGIQQYDVIVSINGQTIEDGPSLIDAIVASGADKPATFVIVRGGQDQTVTITPAEPPESPALSYRYDEPEPPTADDAVRYFGHNLRIGPNGNMIFQPLGRMRDMENWLDQDLGQLQMPDIQSWLSDEFGDMKSFQVAPGSSGSSFGYSASDDDGQHEISISISEDGKSISIHRRSDGTVEVKRKTGGDEKTTVYDNVDQMREKDAEAYEVYHKHVGGLHTTIVPPAIDKLPALQRDFDKQLQEIQKRAQEAIEKARQSRESLEKRSKESDQKSGEKSDKKSDSNVDNSSIRVQVGGRLGRVA